MKNALYILYCSTKNGTGHINRFITINYFLKNIKFDLLVYLEKGSKKIIKQFQNELKKIKIYYYKNDLLKELKKIKDNYQIIFFDKKNSNKKIYEYLKKENKKIIIFDDNGIGKNYADILFDANVHEKETRPNCYYGEKYIIFNKKIILKKINSQIRKKIKNIIICFGGTDPKNITKEIIKIITKLEQFQFFIFTQNKNIKSKNKNVKIINNRNLLINYLSNADLAIISGGLLLYEILYFGLPIITINQNKAQENNCKFFEEKKIICNLGIFKDNIKNKLIKKINELNENYNQRKSMVKIGQKLVDGKGILRLQKLVERL